MREENRVVEDEGRTFSDPLSQDAIRARVIRLAFGGDPRLFDEFVRILDEATPAGAEVILRGSAVPAKSGCRTSPSMPTARARAIST